MSYGFIEDAVCSMRTYKIKLLSLGCREVNFSMQFHVKCIVVRTNAEVLLYSTTVHGRNKLFFTVSK